MSHNVLTMSLLCFFALIVVVTLLSMEGQKARKMNEGLTGLEWHEGE